MKKLLSFLLVSAMCMSLCACGGNTNTSNEGSNNAEASNNSSVSEKEQNGAELVLATQNTVADYADFTLFKVVTGKGNIRTNILSIQTVDTLR